MARAKSKSVPYSTCTRLSDELIVDEHRLIVLEPFWAQPCLEILLVEKEPEEHAHGVALLRLDQRAEVGEAELRQAK